MKELISVIEQDGKRMVNARDLHGALGVRRDFSTWIKNRIEKYGFVEGEDFSQVPAKNAEECPDQESQPAVENLIFPKFGENQVAQPGGKREGAGRPSVEYLLSIGTAKEIAVVENNEKGREIRRHLIRVEESWNSPEMVVRRALQLTGHAIKNHAEHIRPASDAARRVYTLMRRYPSSEDKISKRDTMVLFGSAVILREYFYDTAIVNDALVIHHTADRERLLRVCKQLGISPDDVPTYRGTGASGSFECSECMPGTIE
jgi:phage anti-repressor protein